MARCSLFALVLVWVLTSAAAQATIFNPTTFRLANGLEVATATWRVGGCKRRAPTR